MNSMFVLVAAVTGAGVGAFAHYIYEKSVFPVAGQNCETATGRCFVDAKYLSWQMCQNANLLANMGCDYRDPSRVICTPVVNPMAIGQCVNR